MPNRMPSEIRGRGRGLKTRSVKPKMRKCNICDIVHPKNAYTKTALKNVRDAAVREFKAKGHSLNQTSRYFGLDNRMTQRILDNPERVKYGRTKRVKSAAMGGSDVQ